MGKRSEDDLKGKGTLGCGVSQRRASDAVTAIKVFLRLAVTITNIDLINPDVGLDAFTFEHIGMFSMMDTSSLWQEYRVGLVLLTTTCILGRESVADMSDFQYMGSELEIFAHARHWKSYVKSKLRPYLIGDVLEVGAGIGGTTQALKNGTHQRWVCLEPDSEFARKIGTSPHLGDCE